jgi:hypothetical protein
MNLWDTLYGNCVVYIYALYSISFSVGYSLNILSFHIMSELLTVSLNTTQINKMVSAKEKGLISGLCYVF